MAKNDLLLHHDFLQPYRLCKRLGRSIFSINIVFEERLSSTNTYARCLASAGAPEGTLVLAEEQTEGKGRMGRKWLSPAYSNLLISLVLRPPLEVEQVFALTMVFALATISGVNDRCGFTPMIKWPNDLYVAGRKLGGMLTEFSASGRTLDYVILGLGLNVNWKPGKEQRTRYPATSILAEIGQRVSREDLLVQILKRFEHYYGEVLAGNVKEYYAEWNERSMLHGKRVEVRFENECIYGEVARIDKDGALIILDDKSRERKVVSGDVSLCGVINEDTDDRSAF